MDFYLYRDNYVIKMSEGDKWLQEKLLTQGYELFSHPLSTQEEALAAQHRWQKQVNNRREQGLF